MSPDPVLTEKEETGIFPESIVNGQTVTETAQVAKRWNSISAFHLPLQKKIWKVAYRTTTDFQSCCYVTNFCFNWQVKFRFNFKKVNTDNVPPLADERRNHVFIPAIDLRWFSVLGFLIFIFNFIFFYIFMSCTITLSLPPLFLLLLISLPGPWTTP